jgi:hypothetical protein
MTISAPAPVRDRRSEAEIAAIVRGDAARPADPDLFVSTALQHRMAALLVHAGAGPLLPAAGAARLLEQARADAVVTAVRDRELCRVLCALRAADADVLLIKGAHLAYSHYAEPHLRQRDDSDLLIDGADAGRVAAILAREGYRRVPGVTGEAVIGQMVFDREGAMGAVLDVHTRIAAPRVAAGLLRFDELRARSVPLPRLGPCARGLSPVDALALASIHQSAHHAEHDLMTWTYDTFLLVSRFSAAEIEAFLTMAVERRMAHLCAYALAECVQYFPTPAICALLEELKAAGRDEPTAYLVRRRTPLADLVSDLKAARGIGARLRLILGHLFPPPAYIRHTYGVSSPLRLGACYLQRIVRGGGRWLVGRRAR